MPIPEGNGFPPVGKGIMDDLWRKIEPPPDAEAGVYRHEILERGKWVLVCAAAWALLITFIWRPLNLWNQSWHLLPFAFLSGAIFAAPEFWLRKSRQYGLAAAVACGMVRLSVQVIWELLGLQTLYGADQILLGAALGFAAGLGTRYPLAALWGLGAGAIGGLIGSIPDVWLNTSFSKMGSWVSDSGSPFWLLLFQTFFVGVARFLPIAALSGYAIHWAFEYRNVMEESPRPATSPSNGEAEKKASARVP